MSLSSSGTAVSSTGSSVNLLQSLIDFTKNSNISEWQKELDVTATDLAGRQEESESGRRKLVDQSKEFRQVASEDIRKTVAPLFKSFQTEVDNLSRRSRLAEAAFLSVYKRVINIPDLYPLYDHVQTLTKRTQRISDLEMENKQLTETLDQYNAEMSEVRNQEYTIRNLKEKVKQLEDGIEAKVQEKVRDRETELARKFAEKEQQSEESVQEAVRRQLESEHRASNLQSSLSATQAELLDAKNKLDERSAAQSSEMDMLLEELDKTNERAASAEIEVVKLREQLRAAQSGRKPGEEDEAAADETGAEGLSETERLQNELCSREKEISRLLEDVHRLQSSLNALRVQTSEQVRNHERELSNKSDQLSAAELRLKEQSDYDDIRRELEILKSVEFGGLVKSGEAGSSEDQSAVSLTQPVEILFAEKNKSLQSTVVQLRSANEQLQRDLTAARSQAAELATKAKSGLVSSNGAWSGISSPLSSHHETSSPMPSSVASGIGANSNNYPPSLTSRSPAVFAPGTTKRGIVFPDEAASSPQTPLVGSGGAVNLSANGPSFANGFAGTNGDELDTCSLAMQVREMLLANSIGQRLFAKHVLNLSQGTVSELLSKPKPWRKLTEKGKESYRRMAAWISNPNSLQELKELAPRKGPPGAASFNKQMEDVETEQKISKILEEAREEMMREQDFHEYDGQSGGAAGRKSLGGLGATGSSHSQHSQQSAVLSGLSEQHKSLRDIARYVAGVQRQELVKLMQAAEKNGTADQRTNYSDEIAKLDERIRLIDTMPSDILSTLGFSSSGNNGSTPINNGNDSRLTPSPFTSSNQSGTSRSTSFYGGNKPLSSSLNRNKPTIGSNKFASPSSKPFDLSVSSNLANGGAGSSFPLYPMPEGSSSLKDSSSSTSNVPLPAHQPAFLGGKGTASLQQPTAAAAIASTFSKASLPPISQEEVDKYAELSTDALVKRIKNLLAQYGISQRLFGEQTLGLSQGSVSDMLSRPKPWSQLTHKGREPFIRMAIFLDDPHGIHKLAKKECADCYLSSFTPFQGGTGLKGESFEPSATSSPAAPSPVAPSPMSAEDPSMLISSGGIRRAGSPLPAHSAPKRASLGPSKTGFGGSSLLGSLSGTGGFDLRNAFELNTEGVAQQIKDVLSRYGIGQKVFAEQVLGMSQGSVSDLLNRPKPWAQLTLKGREPYIRMFLWLYDPVLAAQILPPPKRIADAVASGASSSALQQPFVLPGLGAETAQAAVLSTLVSPKDNGDGQPPLTAQQQMAAFFDWLNQQQLVPNANQPSPQLQSSIAFPGSMSSSSSFDHLSGSTPPPAHFSTNRSNSTSATNFSTNSIAGSKTLMLNSVSKQEPVDLSEGLSPAFPQPSPSMAEDDIASNIVSQVPSARSSKRKSANPLKRIANPGSPLPSSFNSQATSINNNGKTADQSDTDCNEPSEQNTASENGTTGEEKSRRLSDDACRSSPTPSSTTDAPSGSVTAAERLHRGVTSDDVGWDAEDDDAGDAGSQSSSRDNDRNGLICRLERNCLPSGAAEIAPVGEPVGVGAGGVDWDQ